MNVFLAKFDPDFLIFLVFILLPILGRVMRAIGKKGEETQSAPRKARPVRRSTEPGGGGMAELERDGRDAWKRLLEGLGPQEGTPPEVVHVPEEPPAPVAPGPGSRVGKRVEHEDVDRRGLPSERGNQLPPLRPEPEPAPAQLAPREKPQVVLRAQSVPETEDLRAVMRRSAERDVPDEPAVRVRGADLRRAVLWSEILGPPVALRSSDGRAPGLREG